jgi:hypothetical protein
MTDTGRLALTLAMAEQADRERAWLDVLTPIDSPPRLGAVKREQGPRLANSRMAETLLACHFCHLPRLRLSLRLSFQGPQFWGPGGWSYVTQA